MLAVLLSLVASAEEGQMCRPRQWSGEFTDATARTAAAKADEIAALEAWAFPQHTLAQEAAREGIRTEGLIVIQGTEVLYERYDRGFTADTRHLTWSPRRSPTRWPGSPFATVCCRWRTPSATMSPPPTRTIA